MLTVMGAVVPKVSLFQAPDHSPASGESSSKGLAPSASPAGGWPVGVSEITFVAAGALVGPLPSPSSPQAASGSSATVSAMASHFVNRIAFLPGACERLLSIEHVRRRGWLCQRAIAADLRSLALVSCHLPRTMYTRVRAEVAQW